MINKILLRITSFYLFILIIFFTTNQLVNSNKILDLLHSIKNQNSDDNQTKNNLASEFGNIIQTIQDYLYNTSIPVCLPGFHSYGGACYFLSPIKSTWLTATNTCSIKRNSSLVIFETNDELDFVVNKLLKSSNVNQAFIGLYATDVGQWHWLDGRTFWDSIFGPLFYVYRPDTSHCGLLNLVNNRTKVAIEGRDCSSDEARFICKYVHNHCYTKNVCGRGGECINLGWTYRCRCNFLYRGRKCDKLSSKAIQSIIALIIIGLMILGGWCLKFDIYKYFKNKSTDLYSDDEIILNKKDTDG